MAIATDQETADSRYVLLIALALALIASAAAFGRVYQGSQTTTRLVFVGLASLGLAAALERRHILLAALVSAAGLLLAVTWLVFPDTAMFGLPTAETLRQGMDALSAVGRASASQPAPAAPIPPLLLAGVTAVWAAAFASHSLAARGRSPFLAIIPPAALIAFASIVMEDGSRPMYVLVFVVAVLGILFADALRRVGGWGPVTLWHGRRKLGVGAGTTARGAWRVGLAALVVATFLPWLLPGFHSEGVLSVQGGPAQSVSINPIVDIRPRLLQRPIVQLAQVHTDQPAYWRLVTDDTFDGSQWRPSNPTAANGTTPTDGVVTNSLPTLPCANPSSDPTLLLQFPKTCPAGYPDDGPRILAIHQQFTFGPLAEPYLPAAASPFRIDVSSGAVRYDPAAQTLVYPDATYRGFRYNVTSVVVVPTPAELNTVTYQAMAEQDASRYTFLPANMPPEIAQIAQQWTVGATTPYQKIMAIQSHLLKFTYDQHVQFAASSNDLLYFLRVAHRGFCEQFAGAMAVLLRSIGIPARVAVGFTPGSPIPTNLGTWSVTTANAHAWVEVLFPNYGWLQFEPTPGRNNPVASPYDAPATVPLGPQTSCARFNKHNICIDSGRGGIGGSGRNRGNSTRYESKLTHELRNTVGQPLPGFRVQPEPLSSRARAWAVRVGLLLLAGLAIGIPAYKLARRRAILRHGRRPDDRVLAAYRALLADASDLGWGRRPSETPREYRDRLTANAPFHNGDLDRLTTLADRAAYGHGVAPDEARQAVVSAKRVTRDLRKATPPLRRMAGLFRIDRS